MHSLNGQTTSLPASGPKLGPAIAQASQQLEKLAMRRDYDHEGWPGHAKIWRELLNQSKERSNRDVAPNILKGDLAAPTSVILSNRSWQSFEKWFSRDVAPELTILASNSGVPALKAIRHSNPKGGRPEYSESIYFLTFVDPDASTLPASQSLAV